MPYRIEQGAGSCSGYAVVVSTSGRVVGCHPTRERAERHRRALYANVPEAREKAGLTVLKVEKDPLARFERLLDDDGFWESYERRVIRAASPAMVDVYMAGMRAALATPQIEQLLGGTVTLKEAARQLKLPLKVPRARSRFGLPTETQLRREGERAVRQGMADWAKGVSATTKKALLDALKVARRDGLGAEYVASRIRPFFSAERARRIAVTEVSRYFAAGAMETYRRLGIEHWVWQTVEDAGVCDQCEALAAQSQDDPFVVGADSEPPAHVLCRCFPRPATHAEERRPLPTMTPWGEMPEGLSLLDSLAWIRDEMRGDLRVAMGSQSHVEDTLERWLAGEAIQRELIRAHWRSTGMYPTGASIADGTKFMREKYPWMTFDFPKADRSMLESVYSRVDALNERFPDTAMRVNYVGTRPIGGPWPPSTYAATSWPQGDIIAFNPRQLNDRDLFEESMRADIRTGFHPRGSNYEFVVTHEYGHAVNATLESRASRPVTYRVSSGNTLDTEYAKVKGSKAATTGYGETSDEEHFAQGFAEWFDQRDTESGNQMGAFFDAIGDEDEWEVSRSDRGR